MPKINLDRRFSEWKGKGQGDPEIYQYVTQSYGTLDWPALLKRRRVVILAEAGSGKSTEFIDQDELANSAGKFSFRTTVRATAEKGFEVALSRQKSAKLESWRQSTDKAWFFLDSVDEAKARGVDFVSALESLADAIAGGEDRAFVFISGRHSDWELNRDGQTLVRILRIPEPSTEGPPVDANVQVVNAIRGAKPVEQPEPEKPTIVVMLPLDKDRVKRFVTGQGIVNFDEFFDAMTQANLLAFARRPLDLNWLADYWRRNGRFGTLNEMLGLSLAERCQEPNRSLADLDTLTPAANRMALERIGAALVLQQLDSIAVPDEGIDLGRRTDALNLDEALPDWQGTDRTKLINRPVFDPADAGFVRLHNDNQGVVRSYLAAHWLERMHSAHCPIKTINEILFSDVYGIKLVKPSMRETVAWMSILNPDIAREAVAIDPWLFLECGDPGSLSVEARSRALSAVMDAIGHDTGISPVNHDALRRFAKPDLCDFIRESWATRKAQPAPRELLLQIIWLGELAPCVDLALEVSFGAYPDRYTQFFSGRALIASGTNGDRERYANYLKANSELVSSDVFWDGAASLFPAQFTVADLIAALTVPELRSNESSYGLSYKGDELVQSINTVLDAERLLVALMSIAEAEYRSDGPQPLMKMFEACAVRLIELSVTDIPPTPAVDAGLLIARIERHRHTRAQGDEEGLLGLLKARPSVRRAVFWRAVDEQARSDPLAEALPHKHLHQLEYYAFNLNLGIDDLDWLLNDANNRHAHAELIANVAIRIWRNANESEDVLRKIKTVGAAIPLLAATVDQWLAPRQETAEELAVHRDNQDLMRKADEQKKKDDESWNVFSDDLRANPLQLRECIAPSKQGVDARLFNIWRVLSRLQGNQGRYSNTDLSRLIPLFGEDMVAEFCKALMAQWRQWKPLLRIDRPIQERNTHGMADLIGILGVSIEAEQNAAWAAGLSDDDAELAVTYATQDLNGFPSWFEQLCQHRPEQVANVLTRWIDLEWQPVASDQRRDLLEDFARADFPSCSAVASHVMKSLESIPTSSQFVVEPALQIVFKGIDDRSRLLLLALDRFGTEPSTAIKACYIGVAFAIDQEASIAVLESEISKLDSDGQALLAQALMPTIFGDDWSRGEVSTESISTELLERLVHLAYRMIRVEDDNDHANGKVYSPDFRDYAQTARSRAFNALVTRGGRGVFDAINRMVAMPDFPIDKRHLKRLAKERAANDAESAAWSSMEIVGFEADFCTVPRTAKDLQRVVVSRLDDLQYALIHGDFNQGLTLAGLINELAIQNWVAEWLRNNQGRSYSVERETPVAAEKKPDIRLRTRSTDANVPIEIKATSSNWTLPDYQKALTDQLIGQYLRDRENRWGTLLIVHQKTRTIGWKAPDGSRFSIGQVIEHLRSMAASIASSGQYSAQVDVILLDVSGVA